MTELAINVKLSAGKIAAMRAKTQKFWTKFLVALLSLLLVPMMVVLGSIGLECTYVQPEEIAQFKLGIKKYYTPVIFSTLSIGLTIACTCLIVIMKKYFHKSLKTEVCRIQTIFLIFTVSYLSRAVIYYVLTLPKVVAKITLLAYELTFQIGYNFWDVIPLTFVMVYHIKKIKPVEDDTNDSLLDDQSSLSARSMNLLDPGILQTEPEFAEILIMN